MQLLDLLRAIRTDGRVTVDATFDVDTAGVANELREVDRLVRLDGPADLPPLDVDAAIWGAERLHAACVLFAHRDLDEDDVARHVLAPFPGDRSAATSHFSVDLSLRYVPDLWRLARLRAPDDPLVTALRRLATHWPLSSVGMPDLDALDPAPILRSPGLLRAYVDRILRSQDRSRTKDDRVARAVEAALGEHREFARSVLELQDRLDARRHEP